MRPLAATLILISVACSSYRITPLATAARQGDTAAIDALVDAGADPDHPSGINGWTPLMHAIHKRQPHAVARLLERNASADAPARDGLTPLMMAAGYGYDETVRLLLGHGANPRLRNRHGLTALDLALTGVGDIDEFTLGRCQTQTVKALLNRAPDLATAPTQRCTEIDVLIRNARYLSE